MQAAQQGYGAALHYSLDGAHWQFLGAVHSNKPSDVLRTGWPGNSALEGVHAVQIGVSVEPLSELQAHEGGSREVVGRLQIAKCIARDLFDYLQSFNSSPNAQVLQIPAKYLDKWLVRFENKYRRDPDFS